VQWDEEVDVCGIVFAGPNIPSCRVSFWRMPKAVDWKLMCVKISTDADLKAVLRWKIRSPKFLAYFLL
jgi:hypothetical protein